MRKIGYKYMREHVCRVTLVSICEEIEKVWRAMNAEQLMSGEKELPQETE